MNKNLFIFLLTTLTFKAFTQEVICVDANATNGLVAKKDINNKYGFVDVITGNYVIPPIYDATTIYAKFDEDRCILSLNNLYGVIDTQNKIIVPFYYKSISTNYRKQYYIVNQDGRYGFLNAKGQELVPPNYDFLELCSTGDSKEKILLSIQKNKKFGIINTANEIIIPAIYDHIDRTFNRDKYKRIYLNKKCNLLDRSHKIMFDKWFDDIIDIQEDFIIVKNNDYYGIVDYQGKYILEPSYQKINLYALNNKIILKKNELNQIYNLKTRTIEKDSVGEITLINYQKKIYREESNKMFGLLDSLFNPILPKVFNELYMIEFSEGLMLLSQNQKYGVYNPNLNKFIIPIEYDEIRTIGSSQTHFKVKKEGKVGVINLSGKQTIPTSFDMISPCVGDKAITRTSSQVKVISLDGNQLSDYYEDIVHLHNNIFKVAKGNKWAILNLTNNTITDFKYKTITFLPQQEAYFLDGKTLFID